MSENDPESLGVPTRPNRAQKVPLSRDKIDIRVPCAIGCQVTFDTKYSYDWHMLAFHFGSVKQLANSNCAFEKVVVNISLQNAEQPQSSSVEHDRMSRCSLDEEAQKRLIETCLQSDNDEGLGLEVRITQGRGRCICTTRAFQEGEFVLTYAGEIVTATEANEREKKYIKNTQIGSYMYFFKCENKEYCIDATKESQRLGHLINHSRTSPNLRPKAIMFRGNPHVIFLAKRSIAAGEELLYDYGVHSPKDLEKNPWLAN
jgi:[histone H4]-lysine20 N-methyltransferase SETD8